MRGRRAASLIAMLALTGTACLGADSGGGTTAGGGTAEGGGTTAEGGGDQTVEVINAFIDEDAVRFEEALAAFEEESGIDVAVEGVSDFEQIILTRVEGGDLPDIAMFPQPGLFRDLASRDVFVPLDDVLDLPALEESLVPGLLELGEVDGQQLAVPYRANAKDFVFHPVPEFEEAGYEVPETMEDLLALTEQIKADGTAPWCIGIESAGATGWVVTDWIELLLLRTAGPEVYDQWVNHEIPFDDPQVVRAAELFAEIAFTEGNTLEGRQGIVTTPFGDSPTPMFEDPPACYLHRQGSFITGNFPEEVQADLESNVGFFYLPTLAEGGYEGQPVLGGADIAGMFSDDEATRQVMEFLASPESGEAWAAQGNFLSPHTTFDPSVYPDELTRQQAEILTNADVFRFDGSDLMPGLVGAGTFWTEMVRWVNDEVSLEEALANIEASWPEDEGGEAAASESES